MIHDVNNRNTYDRSNKSDKYKSNTNENSLGFVAPAGIYDRGVQAQDGLTGLLGSRSFQEGLQGGSRELAGSLISGPPPRRIVGSKRHEAIS